MIGRAGSTRTVRLTRLRDGRAARRVRDAVAVEEPLEIRVSWSGPDGRPRTRAVAVTMRTPGHDFELVAGFLHGESVLAGPGALLEMTYCRSGRGTQEGNVVEARLRPGVVPDVESLARNVYTTSSCGVCGKASLEAVEAAVRAPPGRDDEVRVRPALLARLPDLLEEDQGVFRRTGGLHAAGVFDVDGRARVVREDVGRHNAVDKALGRLFLDGALPARDAVMVVSGRASFEIVQKAVAAGVPVLVAVGAPSSLAVELADRFDQTLVGFARDGGCNVYTGGRRVEGAP